MRVAAVLLIASALAAGCSSQPPPVAPPRSTPAGPTNTPLDAYRNYWQVTNASAANPTARDWSSDIALYTVDPLRSSDIATWRRFRDLGVVQQGTAKISPTVSSQSQDAAQIEDCVDITGVSSSQNGRSLSKPPGYPERFKVDAAARLTDGTWRLSELDRHWQQAC